MRRDPYFSGGSARIRNDLNSAAVAKLAMPNGWHCSITPGRMDITLSAIKVIPFTGFITEHAARGIPVGIEIVDV